MRARFCPVLLVLVAVAVAAMIWGIFQTFHRPAAVTPAVKPITPVVSTVPATTTSSDGWVFPPVKPVAIAWPDFHLEPGDSIMLAAWNPKGGYREYGAFVEKSGFVKLRDHSRDAWAIRPLNLRVGTGGHLAFGWGDRLFMVPDGYEVSDSRVSLLPKYVEVIHDLNQSDEEALIEASKKLNAPKQPTS